MMGPGPGIGRAIDKVAGNEERFGRSEGSTLRNEGARETRSVRSLRVLHLMAYGNLAGTEMATTLLAKGQLACGLQPTVAILYRGGPIQAILRRERIPVVQIGARAGQALLAVPRLVRLISALKPDVLHAHDLRWWSALTGLCVHPGPRLLTIHHQMVGGPTAWRWRLKYRIARRCYHGFSAVSTATLRSVTEQVPLPHSRITVIHNGVPMEAFRSGGPRGECKHRYGCDPNRPLVGYIGRLSPEKGVDDFLRTCREIRRLEPRACFWVIGDGEAAPELMALAERLGLHGQVTFWGNRPDAVEMLRAMDAYLLTSRRESFGLVVLEAMAAGVPVLGFVPAEGGVCELIPGPEVGCLLAQRDPVRLAERVVELFRTESLRAELTGAALRHVQRHFTLGRVTERYLEFYLRLFGLGGQALWAISQ